MKMLHRLLNVIKEAYPAGGAASCFTLDSNHQLKFKVLVILFHNSANTESIFIVESVIWGGILSDFTFCKKQTPSNLNKKDKTAPHTTEYDQRSLPSRGF